MQTDLPSGYKVFVWAANGAAGKEDPGKVRLQSRGFPVNFDVNGQSFPENYDRSGKLRLEKV